MPPQGGLSSGLPSSSEHRLVGRSAQTGAAPRALCATHSPAWPPWLWGPCLRPRGLRGCVPRLCRGQSASGRRRPCRAPHSSGSARRPRTSCCQNTPWRSGAGHLRGGGGGGRGVRSAERGGALADWSAVLGGLLRNKKWGRGPQCHGRGQVRPGEPGTKPAILTSEPGWAGGAGKGLQLGGGECSNEAPSDWRFWAGKGGGAQGRAQQGTLRLHPPSEAAIPSRGTEVSSPETPRPWQETGPLEPPPRLVCGSPQQPDLL